METASGSGRARLAEDTSLEGTENGFWKARNVRRGVLILAVVNIALIGYSAASIPTIRTSIAANPTSLCAGLTVALGLGMLGLWGTKVAGLRDPRVRNPGLGCGLAAGGLFAVEMVCEYLVPHDNAQNEMIGLVTFGSYFLLLIAAGLFGGLRTGRWQAGPPAALWTATVGSQFWFILLLANYHAFMGTKHEARFLEVDQIIADYRRSGMTDLRTFIFEDFMGGGFFHSLLALLFALPLGTIGGLLAMVPRRARVR